MVTGGGRLPTTFLHELALMCNIPSITINTTLNQILKLMLTATVQGYKCSEL
jgi:hypothetical protein